MRNNSSTDANAKSGTLRRRLASSTAGSGSSHKRAPPLGGHALRRQCPRRGFEHIPVVGIAVCQRVLEIVGERPHLALLDELNRRGGDDLVVVVDQLCDGVLDVARARLEDHVAAAHPLGGGHLLDEHHHAPPQLAGEQVVEILHGARNAGARRHCAARCAPR